MKFIVTCKAIAPKIHAIPAPIVIILITALEMPFNSLKSRLLLPSNNIIATARDTIELNASGPSASFGFANPKIGPTSKPTMAMTTIDGHFILLANH